MTTLAVQGAAAGRHAVAGRPAVGGIGLRRLARREVAAARVRFYSGPERPPALPSDGVIKPGREKSDDEKTVRGGIEVSWVTESAR